MVNLITPNDLTLDWRDSVDYDKGILNIKQFHNLVSYWSKLFKHVPIECLKIIAHMAGYIHIIDALSACDRSMMLFLLPPAQASDSMVAMILFQSIYQPIPFLEWLLTHYPRNYSKIRQYKSGNNILCNLVHDLPRFSLVCRYLQVTDLDMMKIITNLWFIDDNQVWLKIMEFVQQSYNLRFTLESQLLPNLIYDNLVINSSIRLKYIRDTWNINLNPDLIGQIEELVCTQSQDPTNWDLFYGIFA